MRPIRLAVLLAAVALLGASLFSQTPDNPSPVLILQGPRFSPPDFGGRISVQSSSHPDANVTVTNRYTSPVVAMVIATTAESNSGTRVVTGHNFVDSAFSPIYYPVLEPGQSRSFPISYMVGQDVSKLRGEVGAVLFADGTGAGDPVELGNLKLFRRCASLELTAMDTVISQAMARQMDGRHVRSSLRKLESSKQMKLMFGRDRDDHACNDAALVLVEMSIRKLPQVKRHGDPVELQKAMAGLRDMFRQVQGNLKRGNGPAASPAPPETGIAKH